MDEISSSTRWGVWVAVTSSLALLYFLVSIPFPDYGPFLIGSIAANYALQRQRTWPGSFRVRLGIGCIFLALSSALGGTLGRNAAVIVILSLLSWLIDRNRTRKHET
jgi:hypothetical protein